MSSGWELVASWTGGTVAGLGAAAAAGRRVVFAATSVGVYSSTDDGRTWSLPATGSVVPFAEAVAPSPRFATDRTVFACANDGLYGSTDAGETWRQVLRGSRLLCVATSSGDAQDHLSVLAGTETDGVLRSEDGGRSWTGANAGLLDLTALAVAASPHFEQDRIAFVGTASGLYRTRNGARSWRVAETGLDEPAIQCLAVSPAFAEDRLVLAGTEADGLLRSDDAGTTWQRVEGLRSSGITAVAFSSSYPARSTVAAATESGVAVSHDGGRTWQTSATGPVSVLSLSFLAHDEGEVLLAGMHRDGVARTDDDAATWKPSNGGLNASLLTGLVLSPNFARDRTLFVAGLHDGVSTSNDAGKTWMPCNTGLENASAISLAVSPTYAADKTLYAASPSGVFVSHAAGAVWQPSPGAPRPVRAVATAPVSTGAAAPTVIAALSDGSLIASDDHATTWRTLRTPFAGMAVISLALSPDVARDRTIFVGTTNHAGPEVPREVSLWRSVDAGATWQRWLVEQTGAIDLLPLSVPPGHSVDGLIFAATGSRVLVPRRHVTEVWAGERRPTWQRVPLDGGTAAVTGLTLGPTFRDDRTLYASTTAGVFRSTDGGERFSDWSDGLIPNRMVAIAVSPTLSDPLVYALGLGGTVWRHRAGAS